MRKQDFHPAYVQGLNSRFHIDELQSGLLTLNGLNGTAAKLARAIANALILSVICFRDGPGPMPQQGTDPSNRFLPEEMKAHMTMSDSSLGYRQRYSF